MSGAKICRFTFEDRSPRIGLLEDEGRVRDLTYAGVSSLADVLDDPEPLQRLRAIDMKRTRVMDLSSVALLAPVERQEVWAAGVTYLRSKTARMEESDFSATAYDRVYDAERPEIFFKSLGEKVVASGEAVGIRRDARWSVPEPELALVLNPRGTIVGYTIGNDMSSRDIEGENLLYLPQAKVYERSCALGPCIYVGASEAEAREWPVEIAIHRDGRMVFDGATRVGQIKRGFEELSGFLCRSQRFPHGAILLTGTGVVPPDAFTLDEGDTVDIRIPAIGLLRNPVVVV